MITQKFITQLAAAGITLSLGVLNANSAQAIGFNFTWQGDGGYSAQGMFSYDENTAPAIFSELGDGPTNYLDSLMVSFFDPSNTLLGTFNDVVDGYSYYSYLTFTFDTVNQKLIDYLDVGQDTRSPGEFYLYGDPQSNFLNLFSNDAGDDIDTGGPVIVSQKAVPEPSALLGLLSMGVLGAGSLRKRNQDNKH